MFSLKTLSIRFIKDLKHRRFIDSCIQWAKWRVVQARLNALEREEIVDALFIEVEK